jgi:very-short-patch-repair endonuclease
LERKLIVEAHGEQYVASAHDAYRTEWLRTQGWRVVRFWHNEIRESERNRERAIASSLDASPGPVIANPP